MKKTYMKPNMSIVKVQTAGMIATSPGLGMYGKDATIEGMGKERGTRNDGDNFEDLW